MTEWRDIGSAPEEGEFVGWSDEHGYCLCDASNWIDRNQEGKRWYFDGSGYRLVTHYQLMPAPPAQEGDQ